MSIRMYVNVVQSQPTSDGVMPLHGGCFTAHPAYCDGAGRPAAADSWNCWSLFHPGVTTEVLCQCVETAAVDVILHGDWFTSSYWHSRSSLSG